MSHPSQELQRTEAALQSVVDILIDSQDALQQIGQQLKDEGLKHYLLAESLKRAEFRGEIESILHREGVHDVAETGTTAGQVHRAWADLKATLGGGDRSLLATAEQTEEAARGIYGKAMGVSMPLPARQLLTSQAEHIRESHETLREARDRTS